MNPPESDARSRAVTPYRFDDIVVDPAAYSVLRAGVAQPVEPKTFAVLLTLLQHPGELVGRDDLLDEVWGHRHVTPGVLTRAIAQLRHALDDDSHQPRYIQTRHALGYSFIGQLQAAADIDSAATTNGAGTDALPSEGLHAAPQPVAPMSPSEPAESPRQEPAGPESAWSAAAPAPTFGPVLDRRRAQGRWMVLTLILIVVLTAWALLHDATAPVPQVAASIAVMPFTSLSSDRDDDYFAEGLTEEMRDALAGVKGLKVVAAVLPAAKSGAFDAKTLGARLGVAAILDASVRRDGSRMRVTARLSDTTTGFTLWSHTYDRELADVFVTQSEIASEVVRALLGAIPGGSGALVKRLTPTHNEAAFDTYLQGLNLLNHRASPDSVSKAIEHFDQALKQDSGFARAQAGVCRAEIWRFESKHNAEAFKNAQLACQRAVQMDPTLAEVDQALGDLYRVSGDSERALQYYRSSARAPAQQVRAHLGAAQVYAAKDQHELAVAEFRQALQMSPGDPVVLAQIGYQQYLDGNVKNAVASYRQAVDMQPGDANLWGTLGALYMETGNNTDAMHALEHAIAIAPAADTLTNLGYLKYQVGDYAAAVDLQRQATTLDPQDFMIWGNLGDALRADSRASAADVHQAFKQAAVRAENYLRVKPDDARAVALLGFYRIMLGDTASARTLVKRAESLPGQPGEVALLNAETLALLGDIGPARERLAIARAKGITETLITSNLTFRRLGLLSKLESAGKSSDAETHAPRAIKGHPSGE